MTDGGAGELSPEVPINLTALLDVMVNLLFFLMLGSAAQVQEVEAEQNLDLPVSTAQAPAKGGLQLEITRADIRLNHAPVVQHGGGPTPAAEAAAAGRIEPLYAALLAWQKKQGALPPGGDVVVLLCDGSIDYALLHRVMQTAASAGLVRFRMATQMDEAAPS